MTENDGNSTVRVLNARVYAVPLEDAAEPFEQKAGIHVTIDLCSRPGDTAGCQGGKL